MNKTAKINFEKISLPNSGTIVLFTTKSNKLSDTAKELDTNNNKFITKAIKAADFKSAKSSILEIISPTITEPKTTKYDRIILVGLGENKAHTKLDWRNLGGSLAAHLLAKNIESATVLVETETDPEFIANLGHGITLRQYKFDKYKTSAQKDQSKEEETKETNLQKVAIQSEEATAAKKLFTNSLSPVQHGVFAARDLVNEPGNILGPNEYAKRIKALSSLGLGIKVLTDKELKAEKMNSLLSVGEGSCQGSYLAIMEWKGAAKTEQPLAIIGKGVTFDTGGISIKGAGGMEDMKGDMGGSATVVGLMQTLAKRKAKINAVGVVGLVENMPDGQATRPGDIVTSKSGQTIEVINTDAEGRLVLADALWYTQEKFNPKYMINLATLTGAIMVALGKEYAGLFSNNDELAEMLVASGKNTGEQVWRMPLGELGSSYDKLINSTFADMKNTGGRWGGAITAAQFLQRFVNETPWAHIDIAGVAMASNKSPINQSWGSGFGVDLLNNWIEENFEK